MKTLVVEDDANMRFLFETLLRARGHEVHAFGDAESALKSFETHHHPLVLSDWVLEGMDGVELIRRMRALPGGGDTIILVITSRNQTEDLLQALAAGADDYLTKPFNPELLIVRLMIAENRVQGRRERQETRGRLDETVLALAKAHADLQTLLGRLQVGTVFTDEHGCLTYVNPLACRLLGVRDPEDLGKSWRRVFPFSEADQSRLEAMSSAPTGGRLSLALPPKSGSDARYIMEAEVQEDPRDPRRQLFFFYDVTEVHDLRKELDSRARLQNLVGVSEPMQAVFQVIKDVAEVDATVLIEGETGTGKELVARAIHDLSPRKTRPFIAVNCAGLTDSLLTSQLFGHRRGAFTGAMQDHEGLFESANGGTLFLDEIGDIPMPVQTALLRVLQEKEITRVGENRPRKIDVRVLCATHRDLSAEVAKGNFRADLLYRIRVARVSIPPLRLRREDIPLMVAAFLQQLRASMGKRINGLESDAMRLLMSYDWPGNVRELRSALEFAVIRCRGNALQVEDLPAELHALNIPTSPAKPEPEPMRHAEQPPRNKALSLDDALQRAQGNRTEAARLMGVSRATFYRLLSRQGTDVTTEPR